MVTTGTSEGAGSMLGDTESTAKFSIILGVHGTRPYRRFGSAGESDFACAVLWDGFTQMGKRRSGKIPAPFLTLPVWEPVIVNYVPVAVFRHPMSVAQSLQKRNDFSIERGLRLWNDYNERLLEIADREDEILFVDFDGGRSHIRSRLQLLAERVSGLHTRRARLSRTMRASGRQTTVRRSRMRVFGERIMRSESEPRPTMRVPNPVRPRLRSKVCRA